MDEVSGRLRGSRVLWFGLRGEDIESLSDLPELTASASVIAAWDGSTRSSISLDSISGRRVDLDVYDIDAMPMGPSEQILLDTMTSWITDPTVLLPYRPSAFAMSLGLVEPQTTVLGALAASNSSLDDKPWVETTLARRGVRTVPWVYVRSPDNTAVRTILRSRRSVIRPERSSGGVGLRLVSDTHELRSILADTPARFLCLAPFFDGAISINAAGVVWRDGISLHPASVQIIGDDSFTTRRFGYCGNDFAAFHDLGLATARQLEEMTLSVGEWLQSLGFLGAFGVDALLHQGAVYFVELNPRLQGSSAASALASRDAELPCVYLEHLASLLGFACPLERRPLLDQPVAPSLVVMHNVSGCDQRAAPVDTLSEWRPSERVVRRDLRPNPGTLVAPNAAFLRVFLETSITDSGGSIDPARRNQILSLGKPILGES